MKFYLKHLARKSYVREQSLRQGELLDCSLGTNCLGVSERVLEAARKYDWSKVWDYPELGYKDLKKKISEFWSEYADLEVGQIQIANGAVGILERLNKMFIEPGSRVLGYSPQFSEYITEVEVCGGKYEAVVLNPEEDFKFHADRMLARINGEHSLIYIDNPNNPTGQLVSLEEIEEILLEAERKEVPVVIDEAYGDYVGRENSAVSLMSKYRNLVVARSFSKGFGLASLRVGYGIFSPELSEYYDRVALPFSVSAVGCYLAAEALADQDFISYCCEMVKREKQKLIRGLRKRGYLISETSESCPIFVLGDKDRNIDLRQTLLNRGVLTVGGADFRNLGGNYVRVNTPLSAEEFLGHL